MSFKASHMLLVSCPRAHIFTLLVLAQVLVAGHAVGIAAEVDSRGRYMIRHEPSNQILPEAALTVHPKTRAQESKPAEGKTHDVSDGKGNAVGHSSNAKTKTTEPAEPAAEAPHVDFKVLSSTANMETGPKEGRATAEVPAKGRATAEVPAKDQTGSEGAKTIARKKPSGTEQGADAGESSKPTPKEAAPAHPPVDFKVLSSGDAERSRFAGAKLNATERNLALLQSSRYAEEKLKGLKVDSYVINLDRRKDRCRCMEKQLALAPQAVYRQPATGHLECDLMKDVATLYGSRNHDRERALFCSNFKVWQRALQSDANFVVIFEDDAILEPSFWSEVANLLQNCSNDFDYISVDSWKGNSRYLERDRVSDVCPHAKDHIQNFFRPTRGPIWQKDYWGTHVQIIRKGFLETMIDRAKTHGSGPLDVWWMHRLNDGKSFSWQPHISTQLARLSRTALLDDSVKASCPAEAAYSDISLMELPDNDLGPRLKC